MKRECEGGIFPDGTMSSQDEGQRPLALPASPGAAARGQEKAALAVPSLAAAPAPHQDRHGPVAASYFRCRRLNTPPPRFMDPPRAS